MGVAVGVTVGVLVGNGVGVPVGVGVAVAVGGVLISSTSTVAALSPTYAEPLLSTTLLVVPGKATCSTICGCAGVDTSTTSSSAMEELWPTTGRARSST